MSGMVPINLASEPFRRLRPMLAASAGAGVLLLGLLALLVSFSVMQRGRAAETSRSIDRLQRQLRTLASEEARVESVLRRPENAEVSSAACS